MEWQIVVALVLAIPVILIPVAFVWYLNVSGIHAVVREAKEKRLAREKNIASRLAVNK
ncbi:hypothetical protein ES703_10961 [subsurface metagenome]